jgi:hypothetical protein
VYAAVGCGAELGATATTPIRCGNPGRQRDLQRRVRRRLHPGHVRNRDDRRPGVLELWRTPSRRPSRGARSSSARAWCSRKNVTVDKPVTITSWDGTASARSSTAASPAGRDVHRRRRRAHLKSVLSRTRTTARSRHSRRAAIIVDDCSFEENDARRQRRGHRGHGHHDHGQRVSRTTAANRRRVYASAPGLITITDSTFTSNDRDSAARIYTHRRPRPRRRGAHDNDRRRPTAVAWRSAAARFHGRHGVHRQQRGRIGRRPLRLRRERSRRTQRPCSRTTRRTTCRTTIPEGRGGGALLRGERARSVTWTAASSSATSTEHDVLAAGEGSTPGRPRRWEQRLRSMRRSITRGQQRPAYTGGGHLPVRWPDHVARHAAPRTTARTATAAGTSVNLTSGKTSRSSASSTGTHTGVQAGATDVYSATPCSSTASSRRTRPAPDGALYVDTTAR